MEAIILAGGFGTRLKETVRDLPKALAPVNGRPFLEYLFDYLITQGVERAVLSVGYKRELIIKHFGSAYRTLALDYAIEEEPLGTGGGIRLAFWKIAGPRAVILNGDSIFRFPFDTILEQHLKRKAEVTLALRKLSNTGRYGRVGIDRNRRITSFTEKDEGAGAGYISAGVYIMEKLFLMEPDFRGRFSIEKDCFERVYPTSRLYGYPAKGYFLDIGIPEDFNRAQHDFAQFQD